MACQSSGRQLPARQRPRPRREAALGEDVTARADKAEFGPVDVVKLCGERLHLLCVKCFLMREQSEDGAVVVLAVAEEERCCVAGLVIDVDARCVRDVVTASPFPPVVLVELGDAACQQAFLVGLQFGQLKIKNHPT